MIKQMQRRFLLVAMASFAGVMILLFTVLVSINYFQTTQRLDQQARYFISYNMETPEADAHLVDSQQDTQADSPQDPYQKDQEGRFDLSRLFDFSGAGKDRFPRFFDYFYIVYDSGGQVSQTVVNTYDLLTENQAQAAGQVVYEANQRSGWSGTYRYVKSTLADGQTVVMYYDAKRDLDAIIQLIVLALIMFVVISILAFIVLRLFAASAVRPIVNNIEKQKEFISNASHEIKTPLAILSTNNDVIEMLGQSNEWTQSNRRQIRRLNDLVEQMLLLARFDEGKVHLELSEVNLTDHLGEWLKDMAILAEDAGHAIQVTVPQAVLVESHPDTLRQVVNALLENAIKYHIGDRAIEVKWQEKERELWIINDCEPMTQEESQQVFDRFYRRDTARNREKGGSGVGLSIAKAQAQAAGVTIRSHLVTPERIAFILGFKAAS
ncbi:TPA: sensor histidine kinase [Streptococcus suis]